MEDIVATAGRKLGRRMSELKPHIKALEDNWYATVKSIAEADADELVAVGLPRKLAVEVLAEAVSQNRSGGKRGGKSKGSGKDEKDTGKGKGQGDYQDCVRIEETDSAFNIVGALIGGKGSNVQYIRDITGAQISVHERAVRISANRRSSLEKATNMTRDLVDTVLIEYREWRREKGGKGKARDRAVPDGSGFEDIVNLPYTKPEFGVRRKIIGENGQNVHHIQDETHTKVYLTLDDDGGQIQISAKRKDDLSAGVDLVRNLVRTVLDDYDAWLGQADGKERRESPSRKGKGKGKKDGDKSKGIGKHKGGAISKVINIPGVDVAFDFKKQLIGPRGKYVQHIENEKNCRIWIDGESGEPLTVNVSADSTEEVDQAVKMVEDLVDSVNEAYAEWQAEGAEDRDEKPSSKRRRT